jgi:hypothetical protein
MTLLAHKGRFAQPHNQGTRNEALGEPAHTASAATCLRRLVRGVICRVRGFRPTDAHQIGIWC